MVLASGAPVGTEPGGEEVKGSMAALSVEVSELDGVAVAVTGPELTGTIRVPFRMETFRVVVMVI